MAASSEDMEFESKAADKEKESSTEGNKESEKMSQMIFFQKLLARSLDVIMTTGSTSQFKKHFKEIRVQNRAAFASITEQLMSHLRSNIEEEINLMIKQEDLANFFNRLDEIVAENSTESSTLAWRPSGDPSEDCRDHLMPVKSSHKEMMKAMLEKIEKENKSLEDIVLPQRARIEENQKQLSQKVQHIKEAAELCQELNLDVHQEQAKGLAKE